MKCEPWIASVVPAIWIAISMIGSPIPPTKPNEVFEPRLIIMIALTVIPIAAIAYHCGKESNKGEK